MSVSRPQAVVVYVTALGMFFLAGFATGYPRVVYPEALLLGAPVMALIIGILTLSVWNGSRVGWVFNVWMWWSAVDKARTKLMEPTPAYPYESSFESFNIPMLELFGALVLLTLLFWPSFFRWVWRKRDEAPDAMNLESTSSASAAL